MCIVTVTTISDTRESAEGALSASNAYAAIVDAINRALNASIDANEAAEKALDLSGGLAEEAEESYERSKDLKVSNGKRIIFAAMKTCFYE